MGKREIVWNTRRPKAECFHTISSFPDFHEQLYNIAQRNIKKEIFRVDIELYQLGS